MALASLEFGIGSLMFASAYLFSFLSFAKYRPISEEISSRRMPPTTVTFGGMVCEMRTSVSLKNCGELFTFLLGGAKLAQK